jgi:hypothetical protein
MIGGVPVAGREDRESLRREAGEVAVQDWHHLVPVRDGQAPAGQKVPLAINEEQRITGPERKA